MHYRSYSIRFSREVLPRQPLTCAQPVIPAFILCLNMYFGILFLKFSINTGRSGRGPTMLISPLRTLKNCGGSSMLVILRNLPMFVHLGSSFFAHTGPVSASAFT